MTETSSMNWCDTGYTIQSIIFFLTRLFTDCLSFTSFYDEKYGPYNVTVRWIYTQKYRHVYSWYTYEK